MKFLGLEIGSWSDLISAFATFLATAFALYLSLKKPKEVIFGFLTGSVFNYDEYYKRWGIKNIIHTLSENDVTINALRINAINLNMTKKVIIESGIIVKWGFKKKKLGNYLTAALDQNVANPIDFGHDRIGVGHIVSLKSYKINPFISKRKVSFKVYAKDTSGKIYKSETFKLDNFK
ncbi:hypothetical protein [Leuconostoc mesenteroides]|uniref:hypothetical protein n=1 Tax=Leuconostoc mesenteroides TaxID=1245 RepID=UPI002362CAB1|nr:hypothetical protein [Leuconostoc mesenteroides]